MFNMTEQAEATYDLEKMVNRTIVKMMDARATGDIDVYFSYFEDALQMALSYHLAETQLRFEKDNRKLAEEIQKIIDSPKLNEDAKKANIRTLRKSFADAHKFFIFSALPAMGIQKVEMDGVVDDSVIGLDELTKIVRNPKGMLRQVGVPNPEGD